MLLKCVAIDDEPLSLELMKEYISKFSDLELMQTFEDAISGAEFIRKTSVDLLFIDINMPDITGIDLVRSLKGKPMIIFITAYKKFAFEGFELDAIDYLLKPVTFERFSKAIRKAIEFCDYRKNQVKEDEENLFVYSEYKLVKIKISDVEYIESLDDYCRIHLSQQRPILTLMPLKKLLEKLPEKKFKRIHRSYIVPVSKIKSLQNRKLQLTSSVELPVGNSYARELGNWARQ